MTFSSLGRKRLAVNAALFLNNVVVLALSARVNQFQEYFFVADLFPLALSIITLIIMLGMIALDVRFSNIFIGRAPFQIAFFGFFSIMWLAFNAFSTARWRHIPLPCDSIPSDFPAEIRWCKDVQALKAFVWIEWFIFFLTTLITARFVITQDTRGNKHIWTVPLSRYSPAAARFSFMTGRTVPDDPFVADNSVADNSFLQVDRGPPRLSIGNLYSSRNYNPSAFYRS